MRPLPRRGSLLAVGGIVLLGTAGSFGLLGSQGPWLGFVGAVVAGWAVWRHRWPTELPPRLRPIEAPQGPDERAVTVEFRHDGALLGWDVGVLWFEKGGVGFLGRTVSFVVPRAILSPPDESPLLKTIFRAPQLTAKVFETTVGIVPLAPEMRAQMTLARIEALPDAVTSETILPPGSMHPDLLRRGLAVRRRLPYLLTTAAFGAASLWLPPAVGASSPSHLFGMLRAVLLLALVLAPFLGCGLLPRSVRERLPE